MAEAVGDHSAALSCLHGLGRARHVSHAPSAPDGGRAGAEGGGGSGETLLCPVRPAEQRPGQQCVCPPRCPACRCLPARGSGGTRESIKTGGCRGRGEALRVGRRSVLRSGIKGLGVWGLKGAGVSCITCLPVPGCLWGLRQSWGVQRADPLWSRGVGATMRRWEDPVPVLRGCRTRPLSRGADPGWRWVRAVGCSGLGAGLGLLSGSRKPSPLAPQTPWSRR